MKKIMRSEIRFSLFIIYVKKILHVLLDFLEVLGNVFVGELVVLERTREVLVVGCHVDESVT